MTGDDRYRCAEHPDGGTVIYDREDGDAWIQSDYAVEVPNRKVGRNPDARGQTGRSEGGDGDRWASESAHARNRLSEENSTANQQIGDANTEDY